jgi:hypothetical protein
VWAAEGVHFKNPKDTAQSVPRLPKIDIMPLLTALDTVTVLFLVVFFSQICRM